MAKLRGGRLLALPLLSWLTSSCVHPAMTARQAGPPPFNRTVTLNGHSLTLHLAPARARTLPLLVFTTGDGGWRGTDLEVFRKLVKWGYPAVGFSAPEYVKYLRGENATTTPFRLAHDYEEIIEAAKLGLELPGSTPVVMVGVSRGAGLAVVAAGQRALRDQLAGVIAIALTKEEEHVQWFRRTPDVPRRSRVRVMLDIYEYLPRLGSVPISVIQSTHDNYLPAEAARGLFGSDTDRRQFHAVEARNHSFSGGRDTLYETLQGSLDWLNQLPPSVVATP
jgi:pimeloyl-ACP methyl ester carboxylesterase